MTSQNTYTSYMTCLSQEYDIPYLDMWMHKTQKRQFETHGGHWSVEAIHVVPSA